MKSDAATITAEATLTPELLWTVVSRDYELQ